MSKSREPRKPSNGCTSLCLIINIVYSINSVWVGGSGAPVNEILHTHTAIKRHFVYFKEGGFEAYPEPQYNKSDI
jgi:hypothetical protein